MIPTFCRVATIVAWGSYEDYHRYGRTKPEGEDWVTGFFLALLVSWSWPAILVCWPFKRWLFAPPGEHKVRQQKDRIRELEDENTRLDRELAGLLK
jgi:hypothetical protein